MLCVYFCPIHSCEVWSLESGLNNTLIKTNHLSIFTGSLACQTSACSCEKAHVYRTSQCSCSDVRLTSCVFDDTARLFKSTGRDDIGEETVGGTNIGRVLHII